MLLIANSPLHSLDTNPLTSIFCFCLFFTKFNTSLDFVDCIFNLVSLNLLILSYVFICFLIVSGFPVLVILLFEKKTLRTRYFTEMFYSIPSSLLYSIQYGGIFKILSLPPLLPSFLLSLRYNLWITLPLLSSQHSSCPYSYLTCILGLKSLSLVSLLSI